MAVHFDSTDSIIITKANLYLANFVEILLCKMLGIYRYL